MQRSNAVFNRDRTSGVCWWRRDSGKSVIKVDLCQLDKTIGRLKDYMHNTIASAPLMYKSGTRLGNQNSSCDG